MAAEGNYAIVFKQHVPEGLPEFGVHFAYESVPEPRPIEDGEVLTKLRYLSVDPYIRGRMKDVKSYFPGFQVGQPGDSGVVLEVIESKSEAHPVGALLHGFGLWQRYQLLTAEKLKAHVPLIPDMPPSYCLGVLGMPGATAYFGYFELCQPREGETVVVSGAAGAVGAIVCQLAKSKGCFVIGIAGTADKCEWLKSHAGCDVAINYKTENVAEAIAAAAPKGVDQYFDNVGGAIKDAVYENLNSFARVSVCGAISCYNEAVPPLGKTWDFAIITKQWRIEGFISTRWLTRWPEAFTEMAAMIRDGKLKTEETIVKGLENTITAFNQMMIGGNTGKMIIEV